MKFTEFFDVLPVWGIFLFSLMITFLSIELGYKLGKWRQGRLTREEKVHTGPAVTASLSLLAFMLAMVFGVVESRFNEMKHVVLDEANAIGTAYLRADLLPDADRAEIRQLLHDYVNLRIEAVQSGTEKQIEQAVERSEDLQRDLWSKAVTIADQQPTPISALFVQSLNELIDIHETRITVGIHNRLPGFTWMVLYGLAILAMVMGGYDTGLYGRRRVIAITVSAAVAFSVVLALVIVLDRPQQHLSMTTQAVMIDLQEDIHRSMQL